MLTIRRNSSFRAVSLLVLTAMAVLALSLDAAEVTPPAELTQDELIAQLMPKLSEEHIRKELAEQLDAVPAELKAALPPDFNQRFIDKYIKEGLPELKAATAKEIKATYTEAELRALLDFHRKHPNIVEKQEKLMKSVMKLSMEMGQRIGKSLA
jgi:hypothetical protein